MFKDRADAGEKLAAEVARHDFADTVVLALPRGGVAVAAAVASRLSAPLDIVLIRKIGAPHQPELALGAIADGPHPEVVLNEDLMSHVSLPEGYLDEQRRAKLMEIEDRRARYLGGRRPLDLEGRTAIVVDDGIATGATTRAALRGVRRRGARRVVLAVPVAPLETLRALRDEVDDVVCLATPSPFYAIGQFYADFTQVSDQDVVRILKEAAPAPGQP